MHFYFRVTIFRHPKSMGNKPDDDLSFFADTVSMFFPADNVSCVAADFFVTPFLGMTCGRKFGFGAPQVVHSWTQKLETRPADSAHQLAVEIFVSLWMILDVEPTCFSWKWSEYVETVWRRYLYLGE